MGRVGKSLLTKIVSDRTEVPASTVHRIISDAFAAITEELAKGNTVTMTGFGTWRSRMYSPRVGRSPQDGSEIEIPARTRVLFKAGSKLRARVEKSIESEIYFGCGVNEATKVEGTLARLFGGNPETFHLEETTARIRAVLGAESEQEAEEFFAALCSDLHEAAKPGEEAPEATLFGGEVPAAELFGGEVPEDELFEDAAPADEPLEDEGSADELPEEELLGDDEHEVPEQIDAK